MFEFLVREAGRVQYYFVMLAIGFPYAGFEFAASIRCAMMGVTFALRWSHLVTDLQHSLRFSRAADAKCANGDRANLLAA